MEVQLWRWWCVLINALAPSLVVGFPGGNNWEWISATPQFDGAQFMDFASPLVQMSANAYRYPATLRSIPGWSLSSQIAPLHPPHGGAHALVFEEENPNSCENSSHFIHHKSVGSALPHKGRCADVSQRVIVAFRGTQIAPSIDSLADLCADKLLWEGFHFDSLPKECSVFDAHTLDYFSQALNYTLQVADLYPSSPVLLTGHSLGAGLAVLVAGALSKTHALHVIGFGAPGTRKVMLDKDISVESLGDGNILTIGHEWDVIMRTQMEGQVGLLCFYPQIEPSSCEACMRPSSLHSSHPWQGLASPAKNDGNGELDVLASLHKHRSLAGLPLVDCTDCFYATHYLKNLINLVDRAIKPICQQARDVSFSKM